MKKFLLVLIILILAGGGVWYFLFGGKPFSEILPNPSKNENKTADLIRISSSKFTEGGFIPIEYTCDDENVSPPLVISEVPKETKSLALILDDPDAPVGTFNHWVLWNISPDTSEIKEREIPQGAVSGKNDFNQAKYNGPCPPNGTHRYFFKVYALDTTLDLAPGAYKEDVVKAMQGHIVAQGELAAKYSRYQKP